MRGGTPDPLRIFFDVESTEDDQRVCVSIQGHDETCRVKSGEGRSRSRGISDLAYPEVIRGIP